MIICVVCQDYPNKKSSVFSFVKQLVDEFARQGHRCYVLSPFSVSRYKCFNKTIDVSQNESEGKITLIRPNYFSLSTVKIGHFCPTEFFFKQSLRRAFSLLPEKPDVILGHFWESGYRAYTYAKQRDIPLFVASGESVIPKQKITSSFRNYVSGVVCVSTKNKKESLELGLTSEDKCIVIPNSINKNIFYRMDKKSIRKKYGFPQNGFIVAFVGWFDNRKGSKRVSNAIDKLANPNIYSIFIGNGTEEPVCNNILFKGNVKHEEICFLLNCADIFVLPTLAEGCCNAIIEAMACGLPIVSSNRDFNDDILNDSNSIRIDPTSVDEIATAIDRLYENKDLRYSLRDGALAKAATLSIDKRAKKIYDFFRERLGKIT